MEKAKILYFGVFIMVVVAFIFHVTAMGHNHWKKANLRNGTVPAGGFSDPVSIGLFTRCQTSNSTRGESCAPNLFKSDVNCTISNCLSRFANPSCSCDYLPSTKGIAACAIIASIFLGLAIIILFIHSINTSETRSIGLILGLFPLLLLLFAFIFILITLILVGSYLSRDIMSILGESRGITDIPTLRDLTRDNYKVRVDWSTGLEIISLFFTFVSLVLYSAFVFKFGRSS
ncbi:unnamed protein product [Adineta ricciae]|uniref:Uncharacterized protein n=1 Tax=Adineta ricciae TaxID=249248 RepID=A0A815YC94_ADIRI|nr:unnamed protein product [Adineta ricciae]